MRNKIKIAPSILSADFANLGAEVSDITKAGSDMIHIDVMDGTFVPNITIGPCVIKSIREYSKLPFDVHLMVQDPEHLFESFAKAGSDIITFHYEAVKDVDLALAELGKIGVKSGISIMPDTSAKVLEPYLDKLDLILVMSVMPGFGGQSFMHNQLSKITEISEMVKGSGIILSVDGGINDKTAALASGAGADMLVSGSYIFGSSDYSKAIEELSSRT